MKNKKRELINHEVKEDLKKPIEQLLTDIHEEILNEERPITENNIHAFKRLASLMARNELESTKLNNKIIGLTLLTAFIGLIQIILVLITIYS